jgi:HJR/Mrr/RecB family endonuclease
MHCTKFNGVIAQIAQADPKTDTVDLLSETLQIPPDKAAVLAARIEKYLQKTTKQTCAKLLLKKRDAPQPPEPDALGVECLSVKEFEYFVKWLLGELGFEVQQEAVVPGLGVDFLAAKDGENLVFLARRYPKTFEVTDAVLFEAQEKQRVHGCRVVVFTTTVFSQQATAEAKKLGVELWDADVLVDKIAEVNKKPDVEDPQFPPYQGSLLQSLLRLEETKLFIIECRARGKHDLFVPWVKYPLLSFQTHQDSIIQCVYRIKYNSPVTESEGESLISTDRKGNRTGPNDQQAYTAITEYLEQFLK